MVYINNLLILKLNVMRKRRMSRGMRRRMKRSRNRGRRIRSIRVSRGGIRL